MHIIGHIGFGSKTVFRHLGYLQQTLFRCCSTSKTNEIILHKGGPANINVKVPFNINISALNWDVYPENDRILYEYKSTDNPQSNECIQYSVDGNNVQFTTKLKASHSATLDLQIPLKSDVDVFANFHITLGNYVGETVKLHSKCGGININEFNGKLIDLQTLYRDINFNGTVNARSISANILTDGSIKACKLLGLKTNLETFKGNISVESCYSNQSQFKILNSGNLYLNNVHNSCKIFVSRGSCTLNGLYGKLDATLNNSQATMQISEFLDNSSILLTHRKCILIMKLSQECIKNTYFDMDTMETHIEDNLQLAEMEENRKIVTIKGAPSIVVIKSGSWIDQFAQKSNKIKN